MVLKILKKKGQVEMVGLVIIVILISLGMLFMAQFALKEKPQKKIFTRKGLAYSTMSAVMKTNIVGENCVQDSYMPISPRVGKDLVEDCAKYYEYKDQVDGYSDYKCGQKHSCVFLNQTIRGLLNQTLGDWGKSYQFRTYLIEATGTQPIILLDIKKNGGCPPTKERDSSGQFPLQTEWGLVENELYLCD